MTQPTFALVASDTEEAQTARQRLEARYKTVPPEKADIIVALGGDGLMLETLHASIPRGTPIYGMNRGTVGFLMNSFVEDGLPERLARAERVTLHPLRMAAWSVDGTHTDALAINEVSLLRLRRQAAHIRIAIDGEVHMEQLVCDGVMVATPAGSTAYNVSAYGPIVPIGAPLLALTPDQRVPAAALARRVVAQHGAGRLRDPRSGKTTGQRHRGLHRGAQRGPDRGARGYRRFAAPAVRSRAQPAKTHHPGAVPALNARAARPRLNLPHAKRRLSPGSHRPSAGSAGPVRTARTAWQPRGRPRRG